jgi:hypothetical protein
MKGVSQTNITKTKYVQIAFVFSCMYDLLCWILVFLKGAGLENYACTIKAMIDKHYIQ